MASSPFSFESLQHEISAYLDRRSTHIGIWLFAVRLTLGIGLAGYITAGEPTFDHVLLTKVLLVVCYLLAITGLRLIYLPSPRYRSRVNALIDIAFLLLLRHFFFFEIAVDPNATMVGLFSLLLVTYSLYSDTILIGIVGVSIIIATNLTLLIDINLARGMSNPHTLPDLYFRTQPTRVIVLMGYLGIVTITTFFLTRRLERLARLHLREQQRVIKAALESSLERSKRENLEHLNLLKGDFISVLAHELRTPIAPLSTALELLEQEFLSGGDLRYPLNVSLQAKNRLEQLVNDYVMLAEILTVDKSKIVREEIDLHTFIPEILKQHQFREDRIALNTHSDTSISSDPRLLGGAILALLRRAESYTPAHEKISLSAYHESERVTISIKDFSSYLGPTEVSSLDDLFSASRERVYHTGNSGLELVLAQHSLKRIGSRLIIDSKKGEGTTISCPLPAK